MLICNRKGVFIMNRIKELRKKKGKTLDQMQDEIGIKRGTISNYENGKTEPKLETWQKLADYFNVSIGYVQGTTKIKDEQLEITDSIMHMGLVQTFKLRYGSDYVNVLNEFISDPRTLEVLGKEQDLLLFNLLLKVFIQNSDIQKQLSDLSNSQKRDVSQKVQDLFKLLTDDTDDQRILGIRDNVKNLLEVYASDNYKLATDTDTHDKDEH